MPARRARTFRKLNPAFRIAHPMRRDAAPTATPLTPWTDSPLRRTLALDTRTLNETERTIEVSFSSDAPIIRWGDYEVLSHDPGACDLSRLNDGGIVLFNHNRDDYVGVVVDGTARIESDRKGRARLRFADTERGNRILADIKAGILRQISIGYLVLEWQITHAVDGNGPDTYTALRWQPYEISIVTVAADASVGVGRAHPENHHTNTTQHTMNRAQTIAALQARGIAFEANATDDQLRELLARTPDTGARSATQPAAPAQTPAPAAPAQPATPAADAARAAAPATATANTAVTDILNLADAYARAIPTAHDLAREALRQGHDVTRYQRTLLDALNGNAARGLTENASIGMSDSDVNRFSFVRFLRAVTAAPHDRRAIDDSRFEIECSEAAARQMSAAGRSARGMVIPAEVLRRSGIRGIVSQQSGAGYAGTGGNIIADTFVPGSYMEILRNNCVIVRNCTPLTGLQGTLTLPKQLTGAASGWVGEDEDSPETDITFGQDNFAHKTVSAYTQVTREMLHQPSLDVEMLVRKDLATAQGTAIDYAGFYGVGNATQPLGIKNVSGIAAVAFAGGNLDYANIVAMETAIATANADLGSKKYIFNATIRGKLKTTKRFATSGTDTVLWEPGGTVNGYPVDITEQVTSLDLFFGVWSEFIYGMWGGLEVEAGKIIRKGRLEIATFQDVNFLLRRPECFCFGTLS